MGHGDSAGGQVQPLPQLTCGSIIPRMRLLMGENNSKSDQTTPVMAPPGRKLPPSAPACCRGKRLSDRNNTGDQTRRFLREDEDVFEIWDAENGDRGSAAVIGRERKNSQEVDVCSWRSRKPQPGFSWLQEKKRGAHQAPEGEETEVWRLLLPFPPHLWGSAPPLEGGEDVFHPPSIFLLLVAPQLERISGSHSSSPHQSPQIKGGGVEMKSREDNQRIDGRGRGG